MCTLLKNAMYKVANIQFELDNSIPFEAVWEKFIDIEKEEFYKKIKIDSSKESFFSNIEIFALPADSLLLRINHDLMIVNSRWQSGKIVHLDHIESLSSFLLQMFYAQVVDLKFILLHSALVRVGREGLMFLGPSGIGKTTQAELWNKYRDALIINGDIVFVQETPDAFLGWGTPWHGSSPYCENTNVPVKALIVLKQAPENSIRELTGFEKVTAVSNSVFYPRWLENGMELCLETLDHLLSALPVYELSCRPDEEAVELVERTVFG